MGFGIIPFTYSHTPEGLSCGTVVVLLLLILITKETRGVTSCCWEGSGGNSDMVYWLPVW